MSFLIAELSERLRISDYKIQRKCLTFPSCFPLPLHSATLVLAVLEHVRYVSTYGRSLPLLFPLAALLFPKIYTGLLYYSSEVSVQISSTQRGLPGRSYLNSNSPPPSTCYLSTVFYHFLNSAALYYIIMFICLLLFPPMTCKLPESGIYFFLLCLGHQGHLEPRKK